jgi:hypothetical protein
MVRNRRVRCPRRLVSASCPREAAWNVMNRLLGNPMVSLERKMHYWRVYHECVCVGMQKTRIL